MRNQRFFFWLLAVILSVSVVGGVVYAQRMIDLDNGQARPLFTAPAASVSHKYGLGVIPLMMSASDTYTPFYGGSNAPQYTKYCLSVLPTLLQSTDTTKTVGARSSVVDGIQMVENTTKSVSHITTNTCTAVSSLPCLVGRVVVNTPAVNGVVTLYQHGATTCAPANFVCSIPATSAGIFEINHTFTNGLDVNTSGDTALDVSILYR
jgi:hypothetical protein